MAYKWKYTEENGYTKIKVSKENHNKVFKYRERGDIMQSVEYYEHKDGYIDVIFFVSLFTKIFATLMIPFYAIVYGVPQTLEEAKGILFQKKTGSFSCDRVYKDRAGVLKGEI